VLIPLVAMPLLSRRLKEPDPVRADLGSDQWPSGAAGPPPEPVHQPPCDGDSGWSACPIAMLGLVTGPANALLFVYTESVLGPRGWRPPRCW
jgi:hypothetical protein